MTRYVTARIRIESKRARAFVTDVPVYALCLSHYYISHRIAVKGADPQVTRVRPVLEQEGSRHEAFLNMSCYPLQNSKSHLVHAPKLSDLLLYPHYASPCTDSSTDLHQRGRYESAILDFALPAPLTKARALG